MDNTQLLAELKNRWVEVWPLICAIYRVGLVDGSCLSDIDLVVVINEKKYKKKIVQTLLFPKHSSLFDLRKVYTRQEFINAHPYLPYMRMELIAGQELRKNSKLIFPKEEGLIKLSALFFTSFLRNFYWLKEKKATSKEILTNLNDFAYVSYWLPTTPLEVLEFNQSIQQLRQKYPEVSQQECEVVLNQGIDQAWKLVAILNDQLKNKKVSGKKSVLFLGREPTLCIPARVERCRELTEKKLSGKHRLKIIYLPEGFQIFSIINSRKDDILAQFIINYRSFNLHLSYHPLFSVFKQYIKKLMTLLLYGQYLLIKKV